MTTATNTSSSSFDVVTALANARLEYSKCRLAYNAAHEAYNDAVATVATLTALSHLASIQHAESPAEVNPFAAPGEVVETEDEAIASRASEDASAYLRNRILDNAY